VRIIIACAARCTRMAIILGVLSANRKFARPVNTSAFLATNPTGDLITSVLPVHPTATLNPERLIVTWFNR
jgi:hypothetical protein